MGQTTGEFWLGIMIGIAISLLFITIIFVLQYHFGDRVENMSPNYLLNSNEWTIDTIKTINRGDTTITYRFIEVE
jgi:hypothetical protein